MHVKTLYVDGYRQFSKQEIELEEQATVIAGANNSGKTSLIDLLRTVMNTDGQFNVDDFNAQLRLDWAKTLLGKVVEGPDQYENFLTDEATPGLSPSIELHLTVDYDVFNDDIRDFADYLMDLDPTKNSFYFLYRYRPRAADFVSKYMEVLPDIKSKLAQHDWSTVDDIDFESPAFISLISIIDKVQVEASSARVYFSDRTFENLIPMEPKKFRNLFHFRAIKASRTLDDLSDDRSGSLNKRLVAVAKGDKDWSLQLSQLPSMVQDAIAGTEIAEVTRTGTLQSLNGVIESISATSGAFQSKLSLDFEVSEENAESVITRAMQTNYSGIGAPLGEASQGLGYSNLILLHLEIESFIRDASLAENRLRVNFLVIEEPESHMHPQMQKAFIKHLLESVQELAVFQALVTTHSHEIVRSTSIELLRVLKIKDSLCRVVDLRVFYESHVQGRTPEKQRLFNFLYAINFSDVLFADKVITYEGDTERMYVQALIEKHPDLKGLSGQYISFVQVGGAYAHIYKPLIIDMLQIKTVILTDIDYPKAEEAGSEESVKNLSTTNATLKEFFPEEGSGEVTVRHLYEQTSSNFGIAPVDGSHLAAVGFQTDKDGYARTLEEAILARCLGKPVWTAMSRKHWEAFRRRSGLKFTIPRDPESVSIRDIVEATSKNKTDFMYSVLLNDGFHQKTPTYVLSSLNWLNT